MGDDNAMISLEISSDEAGRRLDSLLAARCPEFSRTQLARLARNGKIALDGRPAKPGAIAAAGQRVVFQPPESPLTKLEPDYGLEISVIYEDEDILVLDKPWGLMAHPGAGRREPTLAGGLLARNPRLNGVGEHLRPGLAHRLDRDTSGVLITAKNEPALRALSEMFGRRETKKIYLAFVSGRPRNDCGLVDAPIGRHPTQRRKMYAGAPRGRAALTYYKILRHFPKTGLSLAALRLVTGRTHQARVHLQSLGLPVLGDPVYSRGPGDLVKKFPSLGPLIKRQMLHARRLTIVHPVNSTEMTFRAPWPSDFRIFLREILALEKA
ncbi:MAG: RluA family pseudouridine synthase [Candidatus Adiutrix sp.]|jgi:23S rRNA pseudouridine1911/1915/1917 synthase|nr:RluA family pseudouridine synthase [Candidatus Adiutrix sp.]